MKQNLKSTLLASLLLSISSITFASSEVEKVQKFSSMIESDLEAQIMDLEKKLNVETDKKSKHKLRGFFKNVRTAKNAFAEFSKNNPEVVAQYQQAFESLKAEKSTELDAAGQVEYFYQSSQSKVKFGLADVCTMTNTNYSIIPLNIHLLIFGWAEYPSCVNNNYVTHITLGPGLELNEKGKIAVVCALGNSTENATYNVGARGSFSIGLGLNAALAVGQNGICLTFGYNVNGFGASAGLTLLSFE